VRSKRFAKTHPPRTEKAMQIYKNKNPYYRTLFVISISRVILMVLPIFVLVFYFWRIGSENYLEGAGFAVQ